MRDRLRLFGRSVWPGQVLQEKFSHRSIMHLAKCEFELQGKAVLMNPHMRLAGQFSPAAGVERLPARSRPYMLSAMTAIATIW